MTLEVKHPFVSPVPDASNPNEVGPDDWNASHTITGTVPGSQIDPNSITNDRLTRPVANSLMGNATGTTADVQDIIKSALGEAAPGAGDTALGWTNAGLLTRLSLSSFLTGVPANSVGTAELQNNAVTSAKILNGTILTEDIAAAQITAAKIANNTITTLQMGTGSVDTDELVASAVTEAKLGTSAVTTAKIDNGAVTTDKILDDNVTTAKILNLNVTTDKLAAQAVTTAKIALLNITNALMADDSVDSRNYVDGSIDAEHIAPGVITGALLAEDSITTRELAPNAVTTENIALANVTHDKLATDAVESDNVKALAITGPKIAAGAVGTSQLAPDAVDGTKIADDAVNTEHLAEDAVDATAIIAGAVGTSELATDAVTTVKIGAGQVTNAKLALDSVESDNILNGTIVAADIANDTITATQLAADSVGASELAINAVGNENVITNSLAYGKLAKMSANTVMLNNTLSDRDVTDVDGTSMGAPIAAVEGRGDILLGWRGGDNVLVAFDGDALGGSGGLDPAAAEEITGVWKYTNGLQAKNIQGVPNPFASNATTVGMQADYTYMSGTNELLLGAPSMVDNANISIGAVDPATGLATLVFTAPTPSYEASDDMITDYELTQVMTPVPGISLTVSNSGDGLPAGSTINVLTTVESTTSSDVITMELVVDGNTGGGIEMINTITDGLLEKTAVGSISLASSVADGAVLTLQAKHSETGGGNEAWIRGTSAPTELKVFVPASGAGEVNTGKNIGDGPAGATGYTNLFYQKSGLDLEFHNLISSDDTVSIQLVGTAGNQSIDLKATPEAGSGQANTASNVGTGAGVWKEKILDDLRFKSFLTTLNGGSSANFTVTGNADDLTFNFVDTGYAKLGIANTWTSGGNEFTQPLTVGTPTADGHAITKQYFEGNQGEANTGTSLGGTEAVYVNTSNKVLQFKGLSASAPLTIGSNGTAITLGFTNPGYPLLSADETVTGNWTHSGTLSVVAPTADSHAARRIDTTDKLRIDGSDDMTGMLTLLAQDPSSANHATRKSYVDAAISTAVGDAGDVKGPASAADDNIAVFDLLTGKVIKDGGTKISDLALTSALTTLVSGPASVGSNRLAAFSGTDGRTVVDSGKVIGDFAETGDIANMVENAGASVGDNLPTFSGTSGKLIQDSGVALSSLATNAAIAAMVSGPASVITNRLAQFSGTDGRTVVDSGVAVADLATVAAMDAANNAQDVTIGDNTTDISTNAGNIATNTSDISTLDGRVDGHDTSIGTNTSSISTLDGEVTALQGDIIPKGSDNTNANLKISLVAALPGTPDANTLYFVTA